MQLYIKQELTNSLWYVFAGDDFSQLRVSPQGYKHEDGARQYGEGYRDGYNAALQHIGNKLREIKKVM